MFSGMLARVLPRRKVGPFISAGDAAMSRHEWVEAVAQYQLVLAERPEIARIWVQLGHAQKELGNHGSAASAYEKALALEPKSANTMLQMGHLEKLRGSFELARRWYLRAHEVDADDIEVRAELQRLGITPSRAVEVAAVRTRVVASQPVDSFLWDCTGMCANLNGAASLAETSWFLELGQRLGLQKPVFPVRYVSGIGFVSIQWADAFSAPVTDAAAPVHIDAAYAALVVPMYDNLTLIERHRIIASAQSEREWRIIAIARNLMQGPSSSIETERRRKAARQTLFKASSFLIVRGGPDRESALRGFDDARRSPTALLAVYPSFDCRKLPDKALPGRSSAKEGALLIISGGSRVGANALKAQLLSMDSPNMQRWFVGKGDLESIVEAGFARELGAIWKSEAHAWEALESGKAKAVVVAADRGDAEIWAAKGISAGAWTAVDFARSEVFDTLGGSVRYFGSDAKASTFFDSADPIFASEIVHSAWIAAFVSLTDDVPPTSVATNAASAVRDGIFYGFADPASVNSMIGEETGLELIADTRWSTPGPWGTTLLGDSANIVINRPESLNLQLVCKLLVRAVGSDTPRANALRWHSIALEPIPGSNSPRLCAKVTRTQIESLTHGPWMALGVVVYPCDKNHLWYEFIDRASRGLVPAVSSHGGSTT